MNLYKQILAFCAIFMLTACSDTDDPFERVQKLRALGVAPTPIALAPQPGANFMLTVYAAVPLGGLVTAEPSLDDASRYALSVPVSLVPGSESYTEHSTFRLFQARFVMPVPPLEIPSDRGFLALRYAIMLRSEGEEEKIVGNTTLYPQGSPALGWQPPTASIATPLDGNIENKQKIELKANFSSQIEGDNLRMSWFVTSGNLRNRRAKETIWEKAGSGPQSVILTVRGLKSGALAPPQILDLNL